MEDHPFHDDRFAVLIIPTYVNPRDAISSPFATNTTLAVHQDPALREAYQEEQSREEHLRGEGERRNSWKWFHTVNRVCSGVKKVRIGPLVTKPRRGGRPLTLST